MATSAHPHRTSRALSEISALTASSGKCRSGWCRTVPDMDGQQAKTLVRELWNRVDGGWCTSCTSEALEALKVVFPSIDWDAHYEQVRGEE